MAAFTNVGTSSAIIKSTLLGTEIDGHVIADMEYRFNSRYGVYSVIVGGANATFEVYSGLKLESQVEDLSRYLMRNGKKRLGELVGYVPIIGDIVSIPVEVMQDSAQAEADAEFIEEEFKGLKSAEIYSDFDCCANFVQYDTADNSSTVIYAYAGERTDEIITELNTELGSTWTRERLFENPNDVWEWQCELDDNAEEVYDDIVGNKIKE